MKITDAELAAELENAIAALQSIRGAARRSGKTTAARIARTLHRFATHPHMNEERP